MGLLGHTGSCRELCVPNLWQFPKIMNYLKVRLFPPRTSSASCETYAVDGFHRSNGFVSDFEKSTWPGPLEGYD